MKLTNTSLIGHFVTFFSNLKMHFILSKNNDC